MVKTWIWKEKVLLWSLNLTSNNSLIIYVFFTSSWSFTYFLIWISGLKSRFSFSVSSSSEVYDMPKKIIWRLKIHMQTWRKIKGTMKWTWDSQKYKCAYNIAKYIKCQTKTYYHIRYGIVIQHNNWVYQFLKFFEYINKYSINHATYCNSKKVYVQSRDVNGYPWGWIVWYLSPSCWRNMIHVHVPYPCGCPLYG